MTEHRGRGRPPHPDILTPAEWRVLEHIRAGRTNAEIAVRLGVSPNTVRYHVSNILSKLGAEDRAALARWNGRPRRFAALAGLAGLRARPLPTAGIAAGVLAGVVVGVILAVATAPPAESGDVLAAEFTPVSEPPDQRSCLDDLPPGTDYRTYTADELRAAGMADLGPVFFLEDGRGRAVACTALRPLLSGVRFSENTLADTGDDGADWSFGPAPPGTTVRRTWFRAELPTGTDVRITLRPVQGASGPVSSPIPG